ncbi:helix-turn-helix domain-containing protein [Ruminococcaceae bacterium OttesenSCG-928-A11]|nr:helix-turn-helix domain-containing protein [Ruminococcaceae bacterium OttesenSCG-928-A11]
MMAEDYSKILKEYPEHITKEQLYRICHVSKKTALYYLESGLIPCVDSGKKTRRFTIATKDVIQFLKSRDKDPEGYRAQPGWYKGKGNRNLPYRIVRTKRSKKTEVQLTRWLKPYPDLIKSADVSKITGYSLKTVFAWCSSGKLHHFCVRRAILIPKLSLLDFMMSDSFRGIKVMKADYGEFWLRYSDESGE